MVNQEPGSIGEHEERDFTRKYWVLSHAFPKKHFRFR